jgi:hypothetical protein
VEHDKGIRARACLDSLFLTTVIVVPTYCQSRISRSTNKIKKQNENEENVKEKRKGGEDVFVS